MSIEEIPSVKDALNEYFRLKEKFENEMNVNKRKIINNSTLSKREKRSEYLKLMPKCVNCRRPSKKGTIFSITFHPSDDKTDSYRTLKSMCGNLADPCNLNIEINLGIVDYLNQMIENIRNEINETKNNIINDKNKLLFGLITTETALENFDTNKSYINDLTSVYESYLDQWNKKIDNPDKKIELDESLVLLYQNIDKIKECIKKMNENNDSQFAVDAANIYYTTVEPLMKKIRQLKYSENMVFNDESNDTCRLIQHQISIQDMAVGGYNDKVVAFDVGIKAKIASKKKEEFIESVSIPSEKEEGEVRELTIKIEEPGQPKPIGVIEDEPIIGQGKDGIAWNIPEYQKLWDRLPEKLKTEFKLNIDWMKQFMNKCVNERITHGPSWNGCRLTTPPNIVIPPRKMENGRYDFGISIYNKAFSTLPQATQDMYLTFYKEDPSSKVKNYNMLEEAMNDLVQKEVDFGRGFF
jgi:hypothetical protein